MKNEWFDGQMREFNSGDFGGKTSMQFANALREESHKRNILLDLVVPGDEEVIMQALVGVAVRTFIVHQTFLTPWEDKKERVYLMKAESLDDLAIRLTGGDAETMEDLRAMSGNIIDSFLIHELLSDGTLSQEPIIS